MLLRWLKRVAQHPTRAAGCRFVVPRLEALEDRLTPSGNIGITGAFPVDASGNALTAAPDKGEEIFIAATFTTTGLPSNASYTVAYTVDGVTLSTGALNWGAGASGTGSWFAYWGGWYATTGKHNVSVTVDPGQTVAESSYADNTTTFAYTPVSAPDLPEKFITPLGGIPYQTWGVVNYVDVNPLANQIADFKGGDYTYDGHSGHDMTLANFGSMDAGVPEYAAADGTVVAVQDGNFDRNASFNNSAANYIDIDVGNGWHTIYYHLRTDTILVQVGDHVTQGQILGLAGSSGNSTLAHLHFQVDHNGGVVEPELDPTTFWVNPPPYQGSLSAVVDSGVSSIPTPTTTDLNAEERPVDANVFTQASGQTITYWLQAFTRNNDAVSIKTFAPNGAEYAPLEASFSVGESRGGYWYYYFGLPAGLQLGTWKVDFDINGVQSAQDTFQVTAAGAGSAHVVTGSTYVSNGRTTPLDFGSVSPGSTPPQLTFTVANLGSAALHLSNPVLPSGFSLVGSFPAFIAVGGSADFTVQMATAAAGAYAGTLQFTTDDPNAPTYSFNVKGVVTGGNTGEIHGQIYQDLNADGIENGADSGLVGWTVSLLDTNNHPLATTTTSYNGYYAFLNLAPGTYRVRETPPAGWFQSTANPADVTVGTADVLAAPIGFFAGHFVFGVPSAVTAGSPFNFTLTIKDSSDQTITGFNGVVHFTSSDGAAVPPAGNLSLTGGAGTFGATLKTAGGQTISVADVNIPALAAVSSTITVNPAAASQVILSASSSVSSAGLALSPAPRATLEDKYNNVLTNDGSDQITAVVAAGPGSFDPASTTVMTVTAGAASFNNLILDAAGSYTIRFNTLGGLTSAPFSWTVSAAAPPVLTNPGPQTNNEGDANVSLTIKATGADPNTFSATGLPTGLMISTAGVITGTIDPRAAGSSPYRVVVQAMHLGAAGSTTFMWNVADTTPPALSNPGDQTAKAGTMVRLPLTFTDAGSFTDVVNGKDTLPPGLTVNSMGVISGTVAPSAAPSYSVTITGVDADGTSSLSVKFTYNITPPTGGTSSPVNTVVLLTNGSLVEFVNGTGSPVLLSNHDTIRALSTVLDVHGQTDIYAIIQSTTPTGLVGPQYNNTLWEFTSGAWSQKSSGPFAQISAALNSSGESIVFGLLTNGSLWEQSHSFGVDVGWSELSGNGTIKYISAITDASGNDHVYVIDTPQVGAKYAYTLWEHIPAGWRQDSSGQFSSVSAGLNSAGQAVVYAILTNGQLWEQNPAFGPIGLDSSAWHELSGANGLTDANGMPILFNSVQAAGADKVFGIAKDQNTWEHTLTNNVATNTQLTHGLLAAQLSATETPSGIDEVFETLIDGSFWEYSSAFPGNHFMEVLSSGAVASSTPH
jgi:Peptidase family M23/SdrD B-like domain